MKNTRFLQPHRSSRRFPVSPAQVLCVVAALVIAGASPLWLQRGLLAATTPLWMMRTALAQGVNEVAGRLMSRDELEAENERLQKENAELRIKGALYDELIGNVEHLEALLGRNAQGAGNILAHVLASPSASPHDSFIIDVGTADGVAIGDRVLFGDTVAVGRVDLVTARTSRVLLFSAPDMTHEVSIGTTSARFQATGQGGGMFIVRIPKEYEVSPNDALIETGARETLGFVREVEADDTDAFQTVYAVMPVNLFETREVIVVRSTTF
jgi:cell shape-determining protein MreC